jgi:hypothetical protein
MAPSDSKRARACLVEITYLADDSRLRGDDMLTFSMLLNSITIISLVVLGIAGTYRLLKLMGVSLSELPSPRVSLNPRSGFSLGPRLAATFTIVRDWFGTLDRLPVIVLHCGLVLFALGGLVRFCEPLYDVAVRLGWCSISIKWTVANVWMEILAFIAMVGLPLTFRGRKWILLGFALSILGSNGNELAMLWAMPALLWGLRGWALFLGRLEQFTTPFRVVSAFYLGIVVATPFVSQLPPKLMAWTPLPVGAFFLIFSVLCCRLALATATTRELWSPRLPSKLGQRLSDVALGLSFVALSQALNSACQLVLASVFWLKQVNLSVLALAFYWPTLICLFVAYFATLVGQAICVKAPSGWKGKKFVGCALGLALVSRHMSHDMFGAYLPPILQCTSAVLFYLFLIRACRALEQLQLVGGFQTCLALSVATEVVTRLCDLRKFDGPEILQVTLVMKLVLSLLYWILLVQLVRAIRQRADEVSGAGDR